MEGQSIHRDRLLDRFLVKDRFEGGMGVLWTVTDAHTGQPYAIKTVLDPSLAERFRKEAETWIGLGQHENLVQALWLEERETGSYLVLEYVDGGNLEGIGAQPLARALDLAMQCARGMEYAHAKPMPGGIGIVHRDLKPANLLVTRGDLLKIGDFGLARLALVADGVSVEVERAGAVALERTSGRGDGATTGGAGTPAYTAPEQLRGDRSADGRADIYSFGVVLYELLSGHNPFAGDDVLRRAVEHVPPPLVQVPPALSALLARCLEKEPDRRPHSFSEVLAHLARVAREVPYDYHVDPELIPPPQATTGLAIDMPAPRPRRPRANLPFALELKVYGDFGPGPLSVYWDIPAMSGLSRLTPQAKECQRLEAGGPSHVKLRLHAKAPREGVYAVDRSTVRVVGPERVTRHPVPSFRVEVDDAFVPLLVGRAAEMERIRSLSGSVLYLGAAGSGKSRVLLEAAQFGMAAGRRVVAGRAHPAGLRPMKVLHDLARGLLGLPRDGLGDVRSRIHALVGGDAGTARYFAQVLTGQSADDGEAPLAHRWFTLLEAAARKEPLLVLLDDLHLADDTAIRVVVELAGRARDAALPIAIAASCSIDSQDAVARRRSSLLTELWDARGLERSTLAPLEKQDVAALLGDDSRWLLDAIMRTTAGNPSHVAEIAHVLRREKGTLTPERLQEIVPKALDEAAQARLRSLTRETRTVLSLAALVGEEFDAALLKAAFRDEDRVDHALAEMERVDVIRPAPNDPDRYRFWNATVVPLVRRDLARHPRIKRLHRSVAGAMLRVYQGARLTRNALSIAHHLRAAGEEQRALPYTLAGCDRLLGLQLFGRARALLANVRHLAEDLPLFHYLYGIASEATGEYDDGLASLERFVEAGTAIPDHPRSLPRAYARLARIHRARGEFERAQYCLGVARELLETLGDLRALSFVLVSLAEINVDLGYKLAARRLLEHAEALADETGNEGARIRAAILAGRLELEFGRAPAARERFQDALDRSRALGDRARSAVALKGLGLASLSLGYLDRSQSQLEEAIDLSEAMGDRAGVAAMHVHLGAVMRARGNGAKAEWHLRRAQRLFTVMGNPEGLAAARYQRGLLLREAGRTSEAVSELAAASEALARLGLPDRVDALHDLGRALADAGSVRPARMALARADRSARRRRTQRVLSRVVRARLTDNLVHATALARRALDQAARVVGHEARIAAHQLFAEVCLRRGDLIETRHAAETALAFAREQGDVLAEAAAERVFVTLAARAGQTAEAKERAHRAARAYTGRPDARDGPARLLDALAPLDPRYGRAARRCWQRLEDGGFRPTAIAD